MVVEEIPNFSCFFFKHGFSTKDSSYSLTHSHEHEAVPLSQLELAVICAMIQGVALR